MPLNTFATQTSAIPLSELDANFTFVSDSTNLSFLQSGTGAVSRSVSNKLGDYISVKDFNPTADGTTDDLTPLTNFINAVIASDSKRGWMDAKTYAISGALPNITASGVEIYGGGPSSSHDVGSLPGTVIKKITNAGGTMLTIAPTEGASAQRLDGIKLIGVTFDGNSLAAKGVVIKSICHSEIDISAIECTTTGIELNVSTTLGENRSAQYNRMTLLTKHYTNAAVGLRLIGDATANWSMNFFDRVDLLHKNELAQISENADSNVWGVVRAFKAAGGSATNSIEWRGGASTAQSCRSETYKMLSSTVAAIAKGTGTYTVPATNIFIESLNVENSTPDPTIETAATVRWFTSAMKYNLLTVLGLITATGGQIAFPATQVPSADANTLDDYEEGTWTPVITFGTPGNLSVSYSTQVGNYRKIGGLVVASFSIVTSAFTHTTASGNALVTGLPFTAITSTGMENIGAISWSGITKATYTNVMGSVPSADSRVTLLASGSSVSRATVTAADMPTGGSVILTGTVCYPSA